MHNAIWLAAGAAMLSSASVLAQEAPPAADASQQGVLVFEPAFFADARPNTAQDMLNRLPGFSIMDGDGSRGFEGAVGNVLFNGQRPASKSDTGSGVAGRTLATQVERIELIRGGAPGIQMQGYAVVANVILKTASSRQQVLTYNMTTFQAGDTVHGGAYNYTETRGDRSWGLQLSDGVGINDGTGPGRNIRTNGAGVVIRDEASTGQGLGGGNSARVTYAGPFAGGRIDTTAQLRRGDFTNELLLTSPTSRRESISQHDNKGGELGLTYTRPLIDTVTAEGRFIHTFSDFENTSVNRTQVGGVNDPELIFVSEGTSSETILRGLLRQERSATLTVEGGAEVAYNMLDTTQAFTRGGTPVPLPSASVTVEEVRAETFAQTTWRPRATLAVEAGLRLESSTLTQSGDAEQEKSLFYAKPRLQVTWTPRPSDQLRLRYELDVGQLNFGDFAASANLSDDDVFGGNVDLEPEQRWITEAVYEHRFWDGGILTLGLRHDEITDVIDRIPLNGGLSATGNIGEGTLDRAEVSLVLPTDRLRISGGRLTVRSAWIETEVTDPTTGEGRPITRVRPTDFTVSFEQNLQSLKSVWGFFIFPSFQETTYDPDQRQDLRLRNFSNIFVEYKPTANLSIRGQLSFFEEFTSERTVYANRTTRPIDFIERRVTRPRDFFSLRLRQTF